MPFFAYSRCNWASAGISSTHGPHQDAQKLTTTGCPLSRESDCGLPSALVTGGAHNCATALCVLGCAACATSTPSAFRRLCPAKTPTPVARIATNTLARIRLLFIVVRSMGSIVGGGYAALVEQRLHGLRAGT